MTPDEIIKALTCCSKGTKDACPKCPCNGDGSPYLCTKMNLEAAILIESQQKRIEELEERISIMGECDGWIDAKEYIPTHAHEVWVTDGKKVGTAYHGGGVLFDIWMNAPHGMKVTHWMEIKQPEPPKDDQ